MGQDSHQVDLSKYNIRTDLAREAHEMAVKDRTESNIPAVSINEWTDDGITTSWIWIEDDKGSKEMDKLPGTYLTFEVPALRSKDSILEQRVAEHFAMQFSEYLRELGIKPDDEVLIVGLGNWNITPDALGPLVVKHSLVTRHLFKLAPEHVDEGYRSVSAFSPGVMGITGIETSETVHGVIKKVKPDFVIAIDSLASRSLSRVNTTIQIADTGINPGSGVGNKRKALNKKTLGIPVIAIGIPTVVDAVTITHDTIDFVLAHLSSQLQGVQHNPLDPKNSPSVNALDEHIVPQETQTKMMGLFGGLDQDEKRQLIHEVLSPLGQNLFVTPKEVDSFIADMARVVANGMTCALHEAVNMDNVASHIKS